MSANPDYKDLFRLFSEEGVEYLIVGAHAVIYYAEPRYTKDVDILVRPSPENAKRVWKALARFGAPLKEVAETDFTDPDMVYQIGVEPNRIDILMGIAGVTFEAAWQHRVESTYDGVPIHVIGKDELIRSKQEANRPQDRLDVDKLREDDDGG